MPKVSLASFASIYEVLNNRTPETETKIILASNDDRRIHKKRIAVAESKPPVRYHKVGEGQSLTSIADQYHVEVQDLKVWNNLKSTNLLPGQKLIVSKKTAADKIPAVKPANKYISFKAKTNQHASASGRL
jgi:membrane-bound lytic murein transglycosylase D